jgi:predicted aldo/keto reductase-like oxidoreductase
MKESRSNDGVCGFRRLVQAGTAMFARLLPSRDRAKSAAMPPARTAADQVTLGRTGIKLSRLGFGTGSTMGNVQTALGREGFARLFRHAHDQGITCIDTADTYTTFGWISDAIRGLPRERLFIQSKISDKPRDVLAAIDRQRSVLNTDYLDSLLIHGVIEDRWTDDWRRVMDGFDEAVERKWIRARGVSCHSLPAMRAAVASDWPEVHLVRVNPQGRYTDGEEKHFWLSTWHDISPVMLEVKTMHAKGRGVIGMKIMGNGEFTSAEDRERSIRFAMACKEIDAVVIGFASTRQIDEAIYLINRAFTEV